MSRLKILIYIFTIALTQCNGDVAIEQCPGSDVSRIRQQIQYNEISLIFYYTRWSADSLVALEEYNDVAEHYSDKIYFAAIDCWHVACNCSRTLMNSVGVGSGLPHKWPTLMAYYGRQGQQMQYHGLWTFKDIQQFIHNLLQPLERVEAVKQVDELRLVSDAVVLGIFKSPDCREYKQYLMASLKWLESDPLRTYRFTVTFTTNTTIATGWHKDIIIPDLLFMGASDTKRFREIPDHIWNASNILIWLHRELKADLNRLHGYATPITIAQKLKKNPVLAIFVNDPYRFFNYMESMLFPERPYSSDAIACYRLMKRPTLKEYVDGFRIQHIIENLKIYTDHNKCYWNLTMIFKHLAHYYEIDKYLIYLWPKLSYSSMKMPKANVNTLELLNFHHVSRCLNSDVSTSNSLQIGVVKYLQSMVDKDLKLYNSNRTISIVLLSDSERYKDYLQNIDVAPQPDSLATSFIIDMKQESTFLMNNNFSIENIREFIQHFIRYNAMPHFRNEYVHPSSTSTKRSTTSLQSIELENLNRFSFLNRLHYTHNQTIVLLIYSPECSLCGTLQHTFIQLAAALKHSPELQFVRINALLNDLPWQFNMASVPALLVFPKNHFGDTRLFPSHLKPNVINVFAFLLSRLSPEDQMKIVVKFCQSRTLSSNHSQSCWNFAKTLLMELIGRHLHYWQLFENERSLIFERLRAFKDMSLDVQRNLRL